MACSNLICHGCRHDGVGVGVSMCKFCHLFLCGIGECGNNPDGHLMSEAAGVPPDTLSCGSCGDLVCWTCADSSELMPYCQKCHRTLCRDCEQKPGGRFTNCDDCGGHWCNRCAPDSMMCYGSDAADNKDGCFTTRCETCEQKAGAPFTFCHDCGGHWCDGCAPDSIMCSGSDRKTPANEDGCFTTLCRTCETKAGASFTFCDGCYSVWCKDCVPASCIAVANKIAPVKTKMGTRFWRECYNAFCEECAWDELKKKKKKYISARGTRTSRTASTARSATTPGALHAARPKTVHASRAPSARGPRPSPRLPLSTPTTSKLDSLRLKHTSRDRGGRHIQFRGSRKHRVRFNNASHAPHTRGGVAT